MTPEMQETVKKIESALCNARPYIDLSDDNGYAAYNETGRAILLCRYLLKSPMVQP